MQLLLLFILCFSTMDKKKYFTAASFGKKIGVATSTVYANLRAGKIKYEKVKKGFREIYVIPVSELAKFDQSKFDLV